jgi:hypothetical protein
MPARVKGAAQTGLLLLFSILLTVRTALILVVCMGAAVAGAQDIDVPDEPPAQGPKANDWNEFDLGFSTARFGFAIIYESATYKQDADGKKAT